MLLVCVQSYLKSVPRYKFLILDACQLDMLYLCEQGCEYPWLFLKPKGVSKQNSLGHTGVDHSVTGRECPLFGLHVSLSNCVTDGNDFCVRGLE